MLIHLLQVKDTHVHKHGNDTESAVVKAANTDYNTYAQLISTFSKTTSVEHLWCQHACTKHSCFLAYKPEDQGRHQLRGKDKADGQATRREAEPRSSRRGTSE